MRVNRLYVVMNALVLALANLAVPFGLAALPYYDIVHLLYSCVCAAAVFVLVNNENRWRFPLLVSLGLGVIVVCLGIWLEGLDESAANDARIATSGMLPVIYLFLTVQTLLLVKLTGPPLTALRTEVDFWTDHGVGFVFVLFACMVCKEVAFSVLLLLYIGAGVVALTACHFRVRQEAGAVCRVHVSVRPMRAPTLEPVGRLRPRDMLFWGLIVVPLVLLLFLCVPRPDFAWGAESGVEPFADGMDLNRTGRVRLGSDPAFTVSVTDAKNNAGARLSPEQRWRGEVFTTYQGGRWYPARKDSAAVGGPAALPDFGPNQFILTYNVDTKHAGGLVLAEPVKPGSNARGEIAPLTYGLIFGQSYPSYDPSTATLTPPAAGGHYFYTQVLPRPDFPDRMPASASFKVESLPLPASVPSGIRVYTTTLVHDLAAQNLYGLVESDLEDEGDRDLSLRASARGERIAVALADYLRLSRDFNYSLERPRYDKRIDPTEDFLVNVRRGHCERFAGALALMLRSQGVPARVVVGYRGWEMQGNGEYLVRQSAAHAWVEALVPPKGTSAIGCAVGSPGSDYWLTHEARPEWLPLEPTSPYYSPMPPPPSASWLSSLLTSISNWWNGLFSGWNFNLLNFDGKMQADFFSWAAANLPYLLVVLLVLLVLVYLARFALQWLGITPAGTVVAEPFYQRLLQMLAWYRGLEPQPGQTAREFGAATGQVLEAEPRTRAVAWLPGWIIELYYRVRFGSRPLGEEEKRDVEVRLEELKAELRVR